MCGFSIFYVCDSFGKQKPKTESVFWSRFQLVYFILLHTWDDNGASTSLLSFVHCSGCHPMSLSFRPGYTPFTNIWIKRSEIFNSVNKLNWFIISFNFHSPYMVFFSLWNRFFLMKCPCLMKFNGLLNVCLFSKESLFQTSIIHKEMNINNWNV